MRFVALRSGSLGTRISRSCCSSRSHSTKAPKTTGKSSEPAAGPAHPLDNLGYDDWAEIDPKTKTIKTAAGALPISPLLNPDWRKARGRHRGKPPPNKEQYHRFQRQMENNPFAQMLASPVRSCHVTRTRLPQAFLQNFGLIKEPETERLWWIPASYQPSHPRTDAADAADAADGLEASEAETSMIENETTEAVENDSSLSSDSQTSTTSSSPQSVRFFAPAHTLARQDLLLAFFEKKSKYVSGWMRFAANPSISKVVRGATWRQDMDTVILDQMHRDIFSQLVYLSDMTDSKNRFYIIKDDMKTAQKPDEHRQTTCILSFDDDRELYDVTETGPDSASFLPVFNLPRLLGPENVEYLRNQIPSLRDFTTVRLRGKRTIKVTSKLWILQGYIYDYSEA
ncbi:hypothetical protein BD289DRAFT_243718 [Coniella lustricola]|uniref:Uncharacterized protein n=1 Tax=Coniella lustricola TaxID=2025994 RepID=A0A2T3A989_9PEZI|nr:hypothetical protein BD289DRAFT_243718 [Coniella lustricola]